MLRTHVSFRLGPGPCKHDGSGSDLDAGILFLLFHLHRRLYHDLYKNTNSYFSSQFLSTQFSYNFTNKNSRVEGVKKKFDLEFTDFSAGPAKLNDPGPGLVGENTGVRTVLGSGSAAQFQVGK